MSTIDTLNQIDDEPRVLWTESARALVQPMRPAKPAVYAGLPPWGKLQKSWATRAEAVKAGVDRAESHQADVMQAVIASAAGSAPPESLDVQVEAARATLLAVECPHIRAAAGRSASTPTFTNPDAVNDALAEALLEIWTRHGGIAFAVEATARATDLEFDQDGAALWVHAWRTQVPSFGSIPITPLWRNLRRRLCGASDREYDDAVARAEALRRELSGCVRCSLAYAFPQQSAWAHEDARALDANALDARGRASWLFTCITDPPAADALARAVIRSTACDYAPYAFDIVDRLGATEAVPILVTLLDDAPMPEMRRTLLDAIALIESDEACAALIKRLEQPEVQVPASEAFLRSPRRAIPLLARAAASGQPRAEALLAPLVLAHAEIVDAVLPRLDASARAMIDRLRPASAIAALPEASVDDLPRVLASPPWIGYTPRKPRLVPGVVAEKYPERMAWAPGQREAWKYNGFMYSGEQEARSTATDAKLLAEFTARAPNAQYGIWLIFHLTDHPALDLWNTVPAREWFYASAGDMLRIVSRFELQGLAGLIAMAGHDLTRVVEALTPICSSRVAPLMAEALHRLKKARPHATRWLDTFPREAALTLVPAAVSNVGKSREAAETALRWLASHGHKATVRWIAARYGEATQQAIDEMLADDPLARVPDTALKMPAFWNPAIFPPVRLRDREATLPRAAIDTLGTMLAASTLEEPYGGLADVREACDPRSLGAFAWALFEAWQAARMPAKEAWAFQALGHLGDDQVARALGPQLRVWPSIGQIARATEGLDVLALIGTDLALLHLHGISQKAKSRALQQRATERIQQVADGRGLDPEELADRIVPDLELEPDGSRTLDFGARAFRVSFDEQLRPFVKDHTGQRLKDLPKPGRNDDRTKSAESAALWKALKTDARTIAREQITRLEIAMCRQRRWRDDEFRALLAGHPLLVHLVRRLVWGIHDEQNRLRATFRVAEDGTFADIDDRACTLPSQARIGILHPLEMDANDLARWTTVCRDYEILQPFPQLARPVHRPAATDATQTVLKLVEGLSVPVVNILALQSRGWRRSHVGGDALVTDMVKPLSGSSGGAIAGLAGVSGEHATLSFGPGYPVLAPAQRPQQTLGKVHLHGRPRAGQLGFPPMSVADVAPIAYSELMTDLLTLRG